MKHRQLLFRAFGAADPLAGSASFGTFSITLVSCEITLKHSFNIGVLLQCDFY
jgi:hypothetical protein